jgi:hypothetical protein
MLSRVALVRIDVSEECSVSIIRVTRTLFLVHRFLSPWSWRCYISPNHRFLQEPHSITSQKMQLFIVTAMQTSNLTYVVAHKWHIFYVIAVYCCTQLDRSHNQRCFSGAFSVAYLSIFILEAFSHIRQHYPNIIEDMFKICNMFPIHHCLWPLCSACLYLYKFHKHLSTNALWKHRCYLNPKAKGHFKMN